MSHFPVTPSTSVLSQKGFVAYQGRIRMSTASAATTTTTAFTVPALNSTVNVSVTSIVGFSDGDTVVVGERLFYGKTGAGPLANPITFTAFRKGSWRAGTGIQVAGYAVISANGSRTTTTTAAWSVPQVDNASTVALSVTTPANVATNSVVIFTNYAGVYRVVGTPSGTTLVLRKIVEGDLLTGETCIYGDTNVNNGTAITKGTLLGVTPNVGTAQFFPFDIWYSAVSVTGATALSATLCIGFSPNADSGRAIFGDVQEAAIVGATSLLPANKAYRGNALQAQDDQRIGIGWGLPIMVACASANSSTDYTVSVTIRGFYSET